MFEGEKMKKEEPKRPLSSEGRKALEEARAFLDGTKQYDFRLGHYKAPMSPLEESATHEVAIPPKKDTKGTRIRSTRPSASISVVAHKDAFGRAISNEKRIPDLLN
jgi:hypothetical protein